MVLLGPRPRPTRQGIGLFRIEPQRGIVIRDRVVKRVVPTFCVSSRNIRIGIVRIPADRFRKELDGGFRCSDITRGNPTGGLGRYPQPALAEFVRPRAHVLDEKDLS